MNSARLPPYPRISFSPFFLCVVISVVVTVMAITSIILIGGRGKQRDQHPSSQSSSLPHWEKDAIASLAGDFEMPQEEVLPKTEERTNISFNDENLLWIEELESRNQALLDEIDSLNKELRRLRARLTTYQQERFNTLKGQFLEGPDSSRFSDEEIDVVLEDLINPLQEIPASWKIQPFLEIHKSFKDREEKWRILWSNIEGNFSHPDATKLLEERTLSFKNYENELEKIFSREEVRKILGYDN